MALPFFSGYGNGTLIFAYIMVATSDEMSMNCNRPGALKESLRDGIAAGEGSDTLAERVESVMADRIRSSGSTIARTETVRASTTGTVEGWRQSGVVTHKTWLSALDERTRETHVIAHGQTVRIDEDFQVGACSGPGPGEIDCPEESINCRCSLTGVLDVQAAAQGL